MALKKWEIENLRQTETQLGNLISVLFDKKVLNHTDIKKIYEW